MDLPITEKARTRTREALGVKTVKDVGARSIGIIEAAS